MDGSIPQIEPRREDNPYAKIRRQIENAIFWPPGVVVHANRLATRIVGRQGRGDVQMAVASRKHGIRCELTESHMIAAVRLPGDVVTICHDRLDRVSPFATAEMHHSGVNDLAFNDRPSPSEQHPADLNQSVATGQSGAGEKSEVRQWQRKVVQKVSPLMASRRTPELVGMKRPDLPGTWWQGSLTP